MILLFFVIFEYGQYYHNFNIKYCLNGQMEKFNQKIRTKSSASCILVKEDDKKLGTVLALKGKAN